MEYGFRETCENAVVFSRSQYSGLISGHAVFDDDSVS